MNKGIFLIIFFFAISCKREVTYVPVNTPNYQQEWDQFKNSVLENKPIVWDTIIQIEGMNASDYIPMLVNDDAKNAWKNTTYQNMLEIDFFGKPVKVFQYQQNLEDGSVENQHFYFSETPRGLKMVGYLLKE